MRSKIIQKLVFAIFYLAASCLVSAQFATAQEQKVIALVPKKWPPQYQTDKNGKPFGFAVDVIEEVAKIAGYKISYKIQPDFSSTVDALIEGKGDIIPNSGILEDRFNDFIFTSPVETFFVSVIKRSNDSTISGIDDLSGKTVSVVKKNIGLFFLRDRGDIDLKVENDLQDALFSLISGNADAIVYPVSVAFAMARQAGIADRIAVAGAPLREVKRGIRLLKGNEELRDKLDAAVLKFIKTKKYQSIYTKWYGAWGPLLTLKQIGCIGFLVTFFMLALFFVWRQISLRNLNQKLSIQNEGQLKLLMTSLEEKDILVQEIHHRVKNNLQVILSMLSLQKRGAHNENEINGLAESSRRVRVMAKLYELLYQSDNVSEIPAKKYFKAVLDDAISAAGANKNVTVNLTADKITLDIRAATACAQILSELISNCIKHAFPDKTGNIKVIFKRDEEGNIILAVSDDGVGLPSGFDEKKLQSMGLKLVNALVRQLGGSKVVTSQAGTTVTIKFRETDNEQG
jgi:two-component sensor histidine kinase